MAIICPKCYGMGRIVTIDNKIRVCDCKIQKSNERNNINVNNDKHEKFGEKVMKEFFGNSADKKFIADLIQRIETLESNQDNMYGLIDQQAKRIQELEDHIDTKMKYVKHEVKDIDKPKDFPILNKEKEKNYYFSQFGDVWITPENKPREHTITVEEYLRSINNMEKQNEAKKAMLDLCGIIDDKEDRVEMPKGYNSYQNYIIQDPAFKFEISEPKSRSIRVINSKYEYLYYTKEQFQQLINDMQQLLDDNK